MYYTIYSMSNTVCIRHSMYTVSHFAPSEDGLDIYVDILMKGDSIPAACLRISDSESSEPLVITALGSDVADVIIVQP